MLKEYREAALQFQEEGWLVGGFVLLIRVPVVTRQGITPVALAKDAAL